MGLLGNFIKSNVDVVIEFADGLGPYVVGDKVEYFSKRILSNQKYWSGEGPGNSVHGKRGFEGEEDSSDSERRTEVNGQLC